MLTIYKKLTHNFFTKKLTIEDVSIDIPVEHLHTFNLKEEEELINENAHLYLEKGIMEDDRKKANMLKISYHYVSSDKIIHYGYKNSDSLLIYCGNEDVKIENKDRYTKDKAMVTCPTCKNKLNKK